MSSTKLQYFNGSDFKMASPGIRQHIRGNIDAKIQKRGLFIQLCLWRRRDMVELYGTFSGNIVVFQSVPGRWRWGRTGIRDVPL